MVDFLFQYWFYGRISRIEVEEFLVRNGKSNGLFLLCESIVFVGSYVFFMCYNGKIIYYYIQRYVDGMVVIEDGKKFLGLVEFVYYY